MKFITGRRRTPVRIYIYGQNGVGKSSAAADMDDPLFISGSAGDGELDVKRYCFDEKTERTHATSWDEVLTAVKAVAKAPGYKTLVLDEMTAIEQLCGAYVCKAEGWKSIAYPGYSKGESTLLVEMRKLIAATEEAWTAGKNVAFVSPVKQGKVPNPGGEEFKRFEPALTSVNNADIVGAFTGWCDAVLFIELETNTRKIGDAQTKRVVASSDGIRIAHTRLAATYIAKCRYENVDEHFELPATNPLAEFKRQVAEGQDPKLMGEKVRRLVGELGPENAVGKSIAGWLSSEGTKDLPALIRAMHRLNAEVGGAPAAATRAA